MCFEEPSSAQVLSSPGPFERLPKAPLDIGFFLELEERSQFKKNQRLIPFAVLAQGNALNVQPIFFPIGECLVGFPGARRGFGERNRGSLRPCI